MSKDDIPILAFWLPMALIVLGYIVAVIVW